MSDSSKFDTQEISCDSSACGGSLAGKTLVSYRLFANECDGHYMVIGWQCGACPTFSELATLADPWYPLPRLLELYAMDDLEVFLFEDVLNRWTQTDDFLRGNPDKRAWSYTERMALELGVDIDLVLSLRDANPLAARDDLLRVATSLMRANSV